MRMSNSNTPRKFSEKIAILERKQNEENTTFEDIMRQVQSITHQPGESSGSSTTTAPMTIPQQESSGGLLPPQQPWGHNLGGSLPNVHQMPSYSPPQWPPNWHQDAPSRPIQGHRSRSPEDHMIGSASGSPSHHYHPYGVRANGRSPDRLPSHHQHFPQYDHPYNQPGQLVPPDSWNQINRARSDSAIHNMGGMVPMYAQHPNQQMPIHHMPHFIQNAMPGPSGMMHSQSQQNSTQVTPQGSQQGSPLQNHQIPAPLQMGGSPMGNGMSPLQSPNHMMTPMYGFHNGSPLHSPMDSPHASTLMLDGSGTPCMELSPPGMHDFNPADAGSLPNLQNHPQMQQQQTADGGYTNGCNGVGGGYYHAPVGPRHSTGTCGPRLVPGPALTPESQSAPTSPHNQLDPNQPPMWPTRTFSNSPEALDIPKLTITNAEGAPGHHIVDCFNDLNDLGLEGLDSVLSNGAASSSSSQAPPTSFHDPGGAPMLHN